MSLVILLFQLHDLTEKLHELFPVRVRDLASRQEVDFLPDGCHTHVLDQVFELGRDAGDLDTYMTPADKLDVLVVLAVGDDIQLFVVRGQRFQGT